MNFPSQDLDACLGLTDVYFSDDIPRNFVEQSRFFFGLHTEPCNYVKDTYIEPKHEEADFLLGTVLDHMS